MNVNSVIAFRRFLKLISFIGVVPFVGSKKKNKKFLWTRYNFHFRVLMHIAHILYLSFRLAEGKANLNVTVYDYSMTVVWLICYTLVTCLNTNTILRRRHIEAFMAQFMGSMILREGVFGGTVQLMHVILI